MQKWQEMNKSDRQRENKEDGIQDDGENRRRNTHFVDIRVRKNETKGQDK
jgi:hypothetical protein